MVTAADVAVLEGDTGSSPANFALTLHCAAEGITLTAATADGSALAGEDYAAVPPAALSFDGHTELLLAVEVFGDLDEEADEAFALVLSSSPAAALPAPAAEGLILDDDRPPFCRRSPGYWKNHREEWPVDSLRLGCLDYDADGLLALLSSGGSDAATRLARHLAAAKLNLAAGADPWILPVVAQADLFLAAWPPGSDPQGDDRREANRLKDLLDDYNGSGCDDDTDSDSDSGSDSDSDSDTGDDSDSGSDSDSDSG